MVALTESLAPARPAIPAIDRTVVAVTGVGLAAGALLIAGAVDLRQAALFLIGGALGAALYHASFGFTGTWRSFVLNRRSAGLRAQMLMLAVATLLFVPLLAMGSAFGRPLSGAVAPVGVSVLTGAFIFGLGMQLGGGCGSGTLFTVGGGSVRMLVTLAFFIVGAVAGTAHLPWWLGLPSLGSHSLPALVGPAGAVAAQLAVFAIIAALAAAAERRRHGTLAPIAGPGKLLRGPWPLLWGAVALALLNALTLVVAGHPWSVTFAFGLWGAKALAVLGADVQSWTFWTWAQPAKALSQSVLFDTTSVMDFGLVLGAALAAGLAGRFAPAARLPFLSLLAAALGGLLMGYGARLSFGCNVGALFSGIASGSLHGWLWFAAAFTGSLAGIRLRPLFRLEG